jgi:hypothetical protein
MAPDARAAVARAAGDGVFTTPSVASPRATAEITETRQVALGGLLRGNARLPPPRTAGRDK